MKETSTAQPRNEGEIVPGAEEEQKNDELVDQTRQIVETGSLTMSDGRNMIHCLTIIGQVEGHFILPPQNKTTKYEHVIPQIVAIEEDPNIEGLLIILNTVGGDVEAGLAIAELIAGMKKPTVSLVLGGGHSIGVPLAVAARVSFIAPTATMTIHPVRLNGVVVGVPQTFNYFDKMQERIVSFVSQNSHITAERFKQLMTNTGELVMDVGSVLDGAAAVSEGLIDHLGGLADAISCLHEMIEENKKKNETEEKGPADGGKEAGGDAPAQPQQTAANPGGADRTGDSTGGKTARKNRQSKTAQAKRGAENSTPGGPKKKS